MTTADLKNINPAAAALLDLARREYEQAGRTLAVLEMDAAAQLLRNLLGEQAKTALFNLDSYEESGDNRVTTLVVFDADDQLLWAHPEDADDYPGADDLSDEDLDALPDNLRRRIEDHLERAYDLQGTDGALVAADDEHIGGRLNLLLLDIDAALP